MKPSAIIVLVDAYSSGSLYPAEFKKRGFDCIHVQSSPDLDPAWLVSFQPEDFIENIVHHGDTDKTIRLLAAYSPAAVLAGSECGVMLADRLSEKMGLKTNGTKLSEARRNKYLTHELLRQNGIPCADQIKSDRVDEILEWAIKRNIWPVVLKPQDGAGTEFVSFCNSEEELRQAFLMTVGRKNQMGTVNREMLVQEFLNGDEYVVDTVSCEGQHFICALWKYQKIRFENKYPVYTGGSLLPSTGNIQEQLAHYALPILTALEIKHGPAHTEIILTQSGPRLVEVNARAHGARVPLFARACIGYGQIEMSVDAFLDPLRFFQHAAHPYVIKKQGSYFHFVSTQDGIVRTIRHLNDIKALPSFHGISLNVSVGHPLKKTIDLDSSPGYVNLLHDNPAVIQRDYEAIRQWEQEGIFIIA